ncbi:MAG: 4Fe-4S binding protein [Promethearchaeota archaeon]
MVENEIRLGIFLCSCGMNIGGIINIKELSAFCKDINDVVFVGEAQFMCSSTGQDLIKENTEKFNLNRILIASCSPKMHEDTFRNLLKEININPYLLEIVNLREQCSWCHSDDPEAATEKAKQLIKMAIARLRNLESLPTREVNIKMATLIVGGGVTGMRAALDIAERGFQVYLLEKKPYLGGHIVQHKVLFPNNSNPLEIYERYIKEIGYRKIKILTNSEVEDIDGYIGNFTISLKSNPNFINDSCNLCGECEKVCPIEIENEFNCSLDKRKAIYFPFPNAFPRKYTIDSTICTRCGECVKVCKKNAINLHAHEEKQNINVGTIIVSTGFDIYKPINEYGYGTSPNILTLLQMERILSKTGPTKGKIIRISDNKQPKRIVFIGCVGSREPSYVNTPRHYCSRVCCSSIMMNAIHIKEEAPDIEVVVLYRDIRTHGRGEEDLYTLARKTGIKFLRYSYEKKPEIILNSDKDSFLVKVYDNSLQINFDIPCDLIVLASATVPASNIEVLSSKLRLPTSQDGFFQELHPKLAPLNTINKGIYIAGAAQAPKDIFDSISQASGAAAKALIPMEQGLIPIESAIAYIDESLCSGCGICVESCAFNAIELETTQSIKTAQIIEAACKGCGACGASCPSGAIKILHYTDKQIYSALEALLKST